MTFWDHLDELRKTLTYPVIVLVLLTIVLFSIKEPVFNIMLAANSVDFVTYRFFTFDQAPPESGYWANLITTDVTGQIMAQMKVSFYLALMLTAPYLLFKLFRFVAPALYENERRYSGRILFFAFFAFFTGMLINYFVIFPISYRFLALYQVNPQIPIMPTLSSYISMLMSLSVLMGICFELPVISWIMSMLGILKSSMLKKYRRHAIVGILIIAAIITPTADIFTLLLVSCPILLLYEFSIFIAWTTEKKRKKTVELESVS